MTKALYYLTFREKLTALPHDQPQKYGTQVTLWVERPPTDAYRVLKVAGMCVAYGREGVAPTRDSLPKEGWDSTGELKPSGARS